MMGFLRRWAFSEDMADFIFRVLFSSIFLGLGAEHILDDRLIQNLMPAWVPFKREVSVASGLTLISGGLLVALGYRVRLGATILAGFLVSVTVLVHGVSVLSSPAGLPADWQWLWDVFQRSNFVKNLCLLGVCFKLFHYTPTRFTLDQFLVARRQGLPWAD